MAQFIAFDGHEGSIQSVSSIWKVKDHVSRDMAWKLDIFFNFWAQNPMYTGSNGATFVYASYLTVVCVYIQNVEFLALESTKWGIWVCRGKGKAIEARCMECGENCYKRCPIICEVRGAIAMAEIHYNSQKWSSEDPTRRASLPWEFYNSYWLCTHGCQSGLHCHK